MNNPSVLDCHITGRHRHLHFLLFDPFVVFDLFPSISLICKSSTNGTRSLMKCRHYDDEHFCSFLLNVTSLSGLGCVKRSKTFHFSTKWFGPSTGRQFFLVNHDAAFTVSRQVVDWFISFFLCCLSFFFFIKNRNQPLVSKNRLNVSTTLATWRESRQPRPTVNVTFARHWRATWISNDRKQI